MAASRRDAVDALLEQWSRERPDLDSSPVDVIGRVSRLSRLIDRHLGDNFARHGIEAWMYDVLATLRRSGEPYELTAGDLVRQSMVTTGAITNRVDRLEQRGLVTRAPGRDRRTVVIRLTRQGHDLVDHVIEGHLETERRLLASLTARQQAQLTNLLRTVLLELGDLPPGPRPP